MWMRDRLVPTYKYVVIRQKMPARLGSSIYFVIVGELESYFKAYYLAQKVKRYSDCEVVILKRQIGYHLLSSQNESDSIVDV